MKTLFATHLNQISLTMKLTTKSYSFNECETETLTVEAEKKTDFEITSKKIFVLSTLKTCFSPLAYMERGLTHVSTHQVSCNVCRVATHFQKHDYPQRASHTL